MAVEVVGVRLSLTGARQAKTDTRSLNDEFGTTQSRLRGVASAAASATAGLAGIAGRGMVNTARNVATAVGGIAAAAGAVGTAAAASLIKTGIGYNDLEQKSKAAFTTILGSEQAARDMMSQIRDFGRTSPFPRQAFIAATQQLLGFGYQAKDVIPLLQKINDTTAAVGGNADTIATITDVFAQISSQGKVSLDQLNRLSAIGVNGVEAIAEATKQTQAEVRKDISKGNVSAETATNALTSYMEKRFAGASDNVKKTWSGALDRVKGAWRDLGSAIVEPFISTGGGGMAVDWANNLADGLRKAANAAPGLISLLQGNYKGAAATLGWEEDSKQVDLLLRTGQNLRAVVAAIAAEAAKFSGNLDPSVPILTVLEAGTRGLLRTVQGVLGLFNLLARGDYTGNLQSAFGWAEDSKPIDFLFRVRDGFIGLYDLVVKGDYSGKLRSAFGWDEDSQAVDVLFRIRDAVIGVADGVRNFDWSNIQGSLGSIGGSLTELIPAFTAFREALPSVATLGGVAGDALTILAGVLRVAADHVDLLVKAAPYLAAAYVAWAAGSRIVAASVAITNARMILGTGVTLANISANRAHTAALWQNAAAIRGVSVAELQAQAPQRVTLLMRIRTTAALVAQRVATVAMTVVTRAAAAGQWLLNAAMTANPIGIVIALIAALVAGLVWFFTQTDTGRKIITVAWGAIQIGVAAVVDWFTTKALPAIIGFFQGVADKAGAVVGWVRDNWKLLLGIITGPIGAAVILVVSNWGRIRDSAQDAFGRVTGFIGTVIDKVQAFIDKIKQIPAMIRDNVTNVISKLPGGSTVLSALGVSTSSLPGRASGGPVKAGSAYNVGEKGREVFFPQVDGHIASGNQLARMASASPSSQDLADLAALAEATTGPRVVQLVADRKVLAEVVVGGLNANRARK